MAESDEYEDGEEGENDMSNSHIRFNLNESDEDNAGNDDSATPHESPIQMTNDPNMLKCRFSRCKYMSPNITKMRRHETSRKHAGGKCVKRPSLLA